MHHHQTTQATAHHAMLDAPVCGAVVNSDIKVREKPRRPARKTRVVHVSLGTSVGGMEKLLVEFARFTDRQRFDLAFISLQERGRIATDIEDLHWPVYSLNKSSGIKPQLVWKLARRLRTLRPDVVHTHNTAAFFYGVLAATLARVPRIIHTRHGQRFMASNRETWLFRFLSRLVDGMVSVSNDGRKLSISEGIEVERTYLIRNGIDLNRFAYTGANAHGPAILVARLSPEKDVATLIQAMKHVEQLLGAKRPPFTLDIVGDGAMRPQLESLSGSLGLGRTIRFLGERNDIPSLLAKASMFVLPSLTEGISLTLLEAMARGLPVVATRVGGNSEVVVDGRTGLLVPAHNPKALASAMMLLNQRPAIAKEMGEAGRTRVEREFSVTDMLRQYEQQYVDEAQP